MYLILTQSGKLYCKLKEDANKKEKPYCYHRISASILDDSRLTKKWGNETECQDIPHRYGIGVVQKSDRPCIPCPDN